MYLDQPIWWCPYTHVTFRSKSYSAYRLKEGINYAQFLKLPGIASQKSAQARMRIPQDVDDAEVTVELPKVQDATVPTIVIVDETAEVEGTEGGIPQLPELVPVAQPGGTRQVITPEGVRMHTDTATGQLYFDKDTRDKLALEEGVPSFISAMREKPEDETVDPDPIDPDPTPDGDSDDPDPTPYNGAEEQDVQMNMLFNDHSHRIRRSNRERSKVQTHNVADEPPKNRKEKAKKISKKEKREQRKKSKRKEQKTKQWNAEDFEDMFSEEGPIVELETMPGAAEELADREAEKAWSEVVTAGDSETFRDICTCTEDITPERSVTL